VICLLEPGASVKKFYGNCIKTVYNIRSTDALSTRRRSTLQYLTLFFPRAFCCGYEHASRLPLSLRAWYLCNTKQANSASYPITPLCWYCCSASTFHLHLVVSLRPNRTVQSVSLACLLTVRASENDFISTPSSSSCIGYEVRPLALVWMIRAVDKLLGHLYRAPKSLKHLTTVPQPRAVAEICRCH